MFENALSVYLTSDINTGLEFNLCSAKSSDSQESIRTKSFFETVRQMTNLQRTLRKILNGIFPTSIILKIWKVKFLYIFL